MSKYGEWSEDRKERFRQTQYKYLRKRKAEDPRFRLWNSSRINATAAGIAHTISLEDITIPTVCPVLGLSLIHAGKKPNSATIDKIIPELGYVPGNVAVISFKANRLKNNGSLEDFKAIVRYLEEKGGQDNSSEYARSTSGPSEIQFKTRTDQAEIAEE